MGQTPALRRAVVAPGPAARLKSTTRAAAPPAARAPPNLSPSIGIAHLADDRSRPGHRPVAGDAWPAYGVGMACRAISTPGDGSPERRSRRLQIAEARLLAEYLDRARSLAADVDPGVEAQLVLLHASTLRQIEVLQRFEPHVR